MTGYRTKQPPSLHTSVKRHGLCPCCGAALGIHVELSIANVETFAMEPWELEDEGYSRDEIEELIEPSWHLEVTEAGGVLPLMDRGRVLDQALSALAQELTRIEQSSKDRRALMAKLQALRETMADGTP